MVIWNVKKTVIDHISKIMSKCRNTFNENYTIFFQMQENWKRARIRI